tara:strand:+ start:70 stop:699 length:630 start_codon:yes stop_codon:yes gene_type:complete
MQSLSGQDVYTLLAPAGVNTLQTFQDRQKTLADRCRDALMVPALNLQLQGNGGALSGLSVRVPAHAPAHALELLSEGMFRGTSVVRIKSPDAAVQAVLQDQAKTKAALSKFMRGGSSTATLPELASLMPPAEAHDFVWAGNSCVLVASEAAKAAMQKDHDTQRVSFYHAYELSLAKSSWGEETLDFSLRDGCAWQAQVSLFVCFRGCLR